MSLIQDLVCVRYIELGKYIEAIKMDRKFVAAGFEQKEDRRALLKDLYESLSPVEKSLLEAEFKPPARAEKAPQSATPVRAPAGATAANLSQSWEEVPVPESLNKSTNTPLRNIQIPPPPPVSVAPPPPAVPSATAPVPSASNSAPLLPLSNGSTSISANGFTARKSGSLSAIGKGRPPLSGVGQKLTLGAGPVISSPASGIRIPVGSNKPISHASSVPAQPVFVSTVNQVNAFFQPKQTSQKRPLPEEEEEEEEPIPEPEPLSAVSEDQPDEGMEVDTEKEKEKEQEKPQQAPKPEIVPGWKEVEPAVGLNQSIFSGSAPKSPVSRSSARSLHANGSAAKKAKLQPPGAFDEESQHELTEPEPESTPKPKPTRKRAAPTRVARTQSATATSHEAAASLQPKPIRKTRSARQPTEKKALALNRSIPGGLMDDEDGDHEEEEEADKLAPLPDESSSPVAASSMPKARALRKPTRSVAGSDAGSDTEGGPRTRRSSRLSTAGSVRGASPEPVKETVAPKTRKSGKAATTKRKK